MYWRRMHYFCSICCLLLILSACSQSSGIGPSLTSSSTQTGTSPTGTLAAKPVVAQTCPAHASARAAVMPSITTGNHATIVYLSQQGNGSSMLQRYDTVTSESQIILQTHDTETLRTANISPDGQWVLLVSLLQNQSALQLVRIDGQHLQTLYCAPAQTDIDDALLSPDQHFLAFNQVDQNDISILYLLNMTTGQLHTELSPLQPNYPGIIGQVQNTSPNHLEAQQFNPISSRHYWIYIPMKWASTSLYLRGTIRASGAPVQEFALLRDISKDVTQQQSNVQLISMNAPDGNTCFDQDVMPDNRQVLCSAYAFMGPASPTTITLQSLAGGMSHLVYSNPAGGAVIARVLSNSTLIFIMDQRIGPPLLWKINTDGSGLTQLMAAQTTDMGIGFAYSSYLPWSITSRDGTLYALEVSSMTGNTQSLLFGSLGGGLPRTFATNTNSLLLIGWTSYA
ncbi:MAG TPA: hypothetical protein VKR42_11380 [Ktedonobacteraceae bacterium]|nr:hypothetical protein [Ktedonobacteraceae bacterium]